MIILGSIIWHDYDVTDTYHKTKCTIKGEPTITMSAIGCSTATMPSCVATGVNNTCTANINLFFPPIKHWQIICKNKDDVKAWIEWMTITKNLTPFDCRIKGSQGVQALFDEIGNWEVMTMGGFIVIALSILLNLSLNAYNHDM